MRLTSTIRSVRCSARSGPRTIDTGEAHVVTVSQSYDTDPADLWDAVTNIERIPRWFLPISGDLTLGGSYQLEGQAGGTILTCDPPKNFTATWEYGGNVSWIDVSITSEGPDRARLLLEHIIPVDDDEIWREFGPGAVGMGWDSMLLGLAIHLRYRRIHRPVVRAAVDGHRGRSSLPDAVRRRVVHRERRLRGGSRDGPGDGRSMRQGVPRRGIN